MLSALTYYQIHYHQVPGAKHKLVVGYLKHVSHQHEPLRTQMPIYKRL